MRISVHPHADDFERIILNAIKHTHDVFDVDGQDSALEVSTGEVSTYVGVKAGEPAQQLADYAATLISTASRESNRQHLTSHILFLVDAQEKPRVNWSQAKFQPKSVCT